MRASILSLALAVSVAGQEGLLYLPSDPERLTIMEWRKVLDSPYSDLVRRELPPDTSSLLAGINFIEGIERVFVAQSARARLLALEGKFDLERLKDLAVGDGGAVKPYKRAQILLSGDGEAQIALINEKLVLLGDSASLLAALNANEKAKRPVIDAAGDLSIITKKPAPGIERSRFIILIGEQIRLLSSVILLDEALASRVVDNARAYELTSTLNGREVKLLGSYSRDEFSRRAGQWRSSIEQLHSATPPVTPTPGKVRIYGLDEGIREIPLK